MILVIVIFIIQGIIFGIATDTIVSNRGYDENWFWWGFFFGLIAMLVALSKPECRVVYAEQPYNDTGKSSRSVSDPDNDWKCTCGRVNSKYVGTCACGKTREEIKNIEAEKQSEAQRQENLKENHLKLDTLMKMKQLLDSGAITEEEFDQKKKELF